MEKVLDSLINYVCNFEEMVVKPYYDFEEMVVIHKENSSLYYEVDFLLTSKTRIISIEVKSSGMGKNESIMVFQKKYSKQVIKSILLSQKDIGNVETLRRYPIYMLPFIVEDL